MNVQTITGRAFAVYITSEDLASKHLSPCDVTVDAALELISPALGKCGPIRLELFPGRDDLMIFVRKCCDPPVFYRFSSFEELIRAVHACPTDNYSSLYFLDGQYILVIRRWDCDPALSAFSEFGDELDLPPDYLLFLAEHAKPLLQCGATDTIRALFDN